MSEQLPALPAWIDPEAYAGFVEMRKRQEKLSRGKVPWTARAERLILVELYKLKELGHDPNKALDQSTLNGWRDVFAPKQKDTADARPRQTWSEQKAAEDAAYEARKKIEGMVNANLRRVA